MQCSIPLNWLVSSGLSIITPSDECHGSQLMICDIGSGKAKKFRVCKICNMLMSFIWWEMNGTAEIHEYTFYFSTVQLNCRWHGCGWVFTSHIDTGDITNACPKPQLSNINLYHAIRWIHLRLFSQTFGNRTYDLSSPYDRISIYMHYGTI